MGGLYNVKKFDSTRTNRAGSCATSDRRWLARILPCVLLFLALADGAFASGTCQDIVNKTANDFTFFGARHGENKTLPTRLRLIVWNVYKGGKPGLATDFQDLSQSAQLVLLQEATDHPKFMTELSNANESISWAMARSFYQERAGSFTGVATGSTVKPLAQKKLLSPVSEPITNTPKSTLVSDFAMVTPDGYVERVRVVNMHAINFVGNFSFMLHIKQVIRAIREHDGPVIFAGDFNTWSPWRTWFLHQAAKRLGLSQAHHSPGLFLTLDYIFTRGFKRISTEYPGRPIKSSDHEPMILNLELELKRTQQRI